MIVQRKVLKPIGRYTPGELIELEETDAKAFDLLQITAAIAASSSAVAATPTPTPQRRAYRRRDLRAAE